MDFIEYINYWAKSEIAQGRIMIGVGVLVLFAFYFIFHSQSELLKGMLVPLALLILVLVGYGGYILYSRPAHAKDSIARYEQNKVQAIEMERAKHINDNKVGNTLVRIYPILVITAIVAFFFISVPYYKGMAIGFGLLFIAAFLTIVDLSHVQMHFWPS